MGRIGTVKFETGNDGSVELPIFAVGDSGPNVYELLRVNTEKGIGFIPLVDAGSASYPYLRLNTSSYGKLAVNSFSTVDSEVLVDSFEDGDLSEWSSTSDVSITSGRVYEGSRSLYASSGTSNSTYLLGQRSLGSEVSMIELYWQETSNSYGHGYQFLDSDGNRVAGAGSANPQWTCVDGDSGYDLYSGDGYNRWIRLRLNFDYQNDRVTYIFEDLDSGTQKQVTADMDSVGKVTQIQVVNTGTSGYLYKQTASTSGSYYGSLDTWTDKIVVERY